jgi:hypothetical protein
MTNQETAAEARELRSIADEQAASAPADEIATLAASLLAAITDACRHFVSMTLSETAHHLQTPHHKH